MAHPQLVLAALTLVIGSMTLPARGQDPPPEAGKVLSAARTAILLSRSFTYRARHEGTGLLQASVPTLAADVAVERMVTGGPVMARLSIVGQSTAPGKAAAAAQLVFDGRRVRWLTGDGSVSVADPGDDHGGLLKRPEFSAVPAEIVAEAPFTEAIERAALTHEGRKIVESVNCDVILVEYPSAGGADPVRQRWSIGVDDHLPRRLEVPVKVIAAEGAGAAEAGLLLTLSALRRDTPVPRSKFRLTGTREIEVPSEAKAGRRSAARGGAPEKPAARKGLVPVGTAAPEWELKDAEGKPHVLAEYRGRVLVLDFWATWCAPCRESMPRLQALHEKFAGREVVVMGISSSEKADPVTGPAAFMRDNKFTYGLLVQGEEVAAAYGVVQIPTLYVISPDGKVLFRSVALGDGEIKRVETIIEAQLKRLK